jgi:cytochrome bd ubiquinol oxidase subunit II
MGRSTTTCRPTRGTGRDEVQMHIDLQTTWFLFVGALLGGYAVLDGFDLGVGILHLCSRTDEQRRLFLNAIGPVWDGNEVWLVTGGGALFAAFPTVYAAVFSGFYLPMVLLLVGLIFRAVAIEFRSKQPGARWRRVWDRSFSIASIGSSLLMGVAFGNVIWGIPFDAEGEFAGSVLTLLNPFALLTGITTVALFAMHGAIYLVLKTDGDVQRTVKGWVNHAIIVFVIGYATTTMATLIYRPEMTTLIKAHPVLFVLPVLTMLAVANVPRSMHHDRHGWAFISSTAAVLGLFALVGVGMFPILVRATDPARSLTIYNAASSPATLSIMVAIALTGIPFVMAYTVGIYWIFRGKVRLDSMSY